MISVIESQGGAASVALNLAVVLPRTYQVRVGDEPVVLLVDVHVNKLLGVVANRLTPAVDQVISQAQSGVDADDARFRRCGVLESILGAGFVYLTFEYAESLSGDARATTLLKPTLAGMLRYGAAPGAAELLTVGGAL